MTEHEEDNAQDRLFKKFYKAARAGETETVKKLCETGAQVDRRGTDGRRTALQLACRYGHLSTAEYLIKEAKADVDTRDDWNNTALHLAAERGRADVVRLLCDHGADIDGKGKYGHTALSLACLNDHLSTAECLIARGASLNEQADLGSTPLHLSSWNGRLQMVQLLLEKGADASIKNKRGKTAREVAGRGCSMYDEKMRLEIASCFDHI